MKDIIERILREEVLLPSDAEAIFRAMGKILHEAAERTKQTEPYATNSIRELQHFSCMVDDYEDFLKKFS